MFSVQQAVEWQQRQRHKSRVNVNCRSLASCAQTNKSEFRPEFGRSLWTNSFKARCDRNSAKVHCKLLSLSYLIIAWNENCSLSLKRTLARCVPNMIISCEANFKQISNCGQAFCKHSILRLTSMFLPLFASFSFLFCI